MILNKKAMTLNDIKYLRLCTEVLSHNASEMGAYQSEGYLWAIDDMNKELDIMERKVKEGKMDMPDDDSKRTK